jgi:N-hydroxyarylamine O-acetyltransferase
MKADNFVLNDYMHRIRYNGEPNADISTVTELMRCQLFTVPFENLDVQSSKIVSLVPEEIVEKIVYRNRGGYCYEVNGIFSMALEAIGVRHQFVAARPMTYPTRRPRTHIAIVITIDEEEWLCDLGFGPYNIRYPLKIRKIDTEVYHDYEVFILKKENEREYLLKQFFYGEWINLYAFDLWPQEWIDFLPANYFNSTHPESLFFQKLLAVIHNPVGKKFLIGDTITIYEKGNAIKRSVPVDELDTVLGKTFGLPPISDVR